MKDLFLPAGFVRTTLPALSHQEAQAMLVLLATGGGKVEEVVRLLPPGVRRRTLDALARKGVAAFVVSKSLEIAVYPQMPSSPQRNSEEGKRLRRVRKGTDKAPYFKGVRIPRETLMALAPLGRAGVLWIFLRSNGPYPTSINRLSQRLGWGWRQTNALLATLEEQGLLMRGALHEEFEHLEISQYFTPVLSDPPPVDVPTVTRVHGHFVHKRPRRKVMRTAKETLRILRSVQWGAGESLIPQWLQVLGYTGDQGAVLRNGGTGYLQPDRIAQRVATGNARPRLTPLSVEDFVASCPRDGEATPRQVYRRYLSYCWANSRAPVSPQAFFRAIRKHVTPVKRQGKTVYLGISVSPKTVFFSTPVILQPGSIPLPSTLGNLGWPIPGESGVSWEELLHTCGWGPDSSCEGDFGEGDWGEGDWGEGNWGDNWGPDDNPDYDSCPTPIWPFPPGPLGWVSGPSPPELPDY